MPIKPLLFCASCGSAASAQTSAANPVATAPASSFDVSSFTAELHRISGVLAKKPSPAELTSLRQSLPAEWNVRTPDRLFSISTDFLRGQLNEGKLDAAQEWLDHLASETGSYSATPPVPPVDAQAELNRILAENDFASVRPPTPWELFRQRVAAWFERMLLQLFAGMQRYPIGGQILFWLVILAGVSFIAFALFRFVTRFDRLHTLAPTAFVVPSRSWQEWVRLAREAAARADFREAVHAAYWAGIVRLQETGVHPKDRSKTPREYLRLATQRLPSGTSPNPALREPLAGLTTRLERIWYANRTAGPDDFRDSLLQLEALGCRLE